MFRRDEERRYTHDCNICPSFPSDSSFAGFFANQFRKPIVFDPVGVGASAFRQETVNGTVSLGMNLNVVNRLMLEPKNS